MACWAGLGRVHHPHVLEPVPVGQLVHDPGPVPELAVGKPQVCSGHGHSDSFDRVGAEAHHTGDCPCREQLVVLRVAPRAR